MPSSVNPVLGLSGLPLALASPSLLSHAARPAFPGVAAGDGTGLDLGLLGDDRM
jgi:hypothetical protein